MIETPGHPKHLRRLSVLMLGAQLFLKSHSVQWEYLGREPTLPGGTVFACDGLFFENYVHKRMRMHALQCSAAIEEQ